ncbi:MAG: hypothetical protein ACLRZH_05640 [Ruthenibacterium lactatiformans]
MYLLPGNVTGLDDVLAESVIILTLLAGTVSCPRLRWAWCGFRSGGRGASAPYACR